MNAILTLVALGLGDPPAPAALVCPAPIAAKGEVKGGPLLPHTFELTHRGPAGTITITKIEAGCGCLRRTLSAGVLQPGETVKLTLEVNTLTQPDGPNRWQAVVGYTLDLPGPPAASRTGEVLLAMTATVAREVVVAPPQLGFSCTGEAAQTLTVTDRRAKPLTVVRAASSSPHLTAEVGQPAAGPGGIRTQLVTLKLTAAAPPGHRDEAVVLLTDDPEYPEFRVPVRVLKRAAGAVTAAPDEVTVRLAPGEEEVSALVQLRAPDGKPVRVEAAESDFPGVAVKWSPGAGPVATVRLTVSGAVARQPGGCRVRVRLAEPAGQEVVVPVSWTGGTRK
ncbi:MAG: hypothetical protein JWO38_5961 [Gemmataceae bacterium]|nr:hypothetical protein [Gemmataceae bacterium]